MRLKQFARLVASHGANPARWPPERRTGALALLEVSEPARALQRRAATLDTLLDSAPTAPAGQTLRSRILALPHQPVAPVRIKTTDAAPAPYWGRLWPRLATLAMAGLLGILVGFTNFGRSFDQDPVADLGQLILGGVDVNGPVL